MCRRCGEPDRRGSSRDRRLRRAWLWDTYSEHGWIPCAWCDRKLRKTQFEVDRLIPGCDGGTYRRSNIVPSCPPCNRGRKYDYEGCNTDFNTLRTVEPVPPAWLERAA